MRGPREERTHRWTVFGVLALISSVALGLGFSVETHGRINGASQLCWAIAAGTFMLGIWVLVRPYNAGLVDVDTLNTVPTPHTPPPVSAPAAPSTSGASEERIDVDVTPEHLTGFFENRLAVHAQALAEPFIGNWMTLEGPLRNVGIWTGGFSQVTFNRPDRAHVGMIFRDKPEVDRLGLLKRGDRVTAHGRIDRIDFQSVTLDPCELVGVVLVPVREQLVAARAAGEALRDEEIDENDPGAVADWVARKQAWLQQTFNWLRRDVSTDDAVTFRDVGELGSLDGYALIEEYGSYHKVHLVWHERELLNLTTLIERLG